MTAGSQTEHTGDIMTIGDNLMEFNGKPVRDFDPECGIENPEVICYRLRVDYDASQSGSTLPVQIEEFAQQPNASRVTELVIGAWSQPSRVSCTRRKRTAPRRARALSAGETRDRDGRHVGKAHERRHQRKSSPNSNTWSCGSVSRTTALMPTSKTCGRC